MKVLLVEDDVSLATELLEMFREYSLDAHHAADWTAAVDCITTLSPRIILLDQRLGRVDTLTRLSQLRQMTGAHVIMLTANQEEADRIVALELGADDFLVKPVSGREIVARIRARLRRGDTRAPALAAKPSGQWRVGVTERRLYRPDGQRCYLTSTEFELFLLLYRNAGKPVSRPEIARKILRREYLEGDRSVDALVFMIRKRLGRTTGAACIEAVRKEGYCFTGFPEEC